MDKKQMNNRYPFFFCFHYSFCCVKNTISIITEGRWFPVRKN